MTEIVENNLQECSFSLINVRSYEYITLQKMRCINID